MCQGRSVFWGDIVTFVFNHKNIVTMKSKTNAGVGGDACMTFSGFMRDVIGQLVRLHHERTAEIYMSALNSFMCFRGGRDVELGCVDSDMVMEYEAWLKRRGATMNTVSFYNRVLRAVYNRAVERGLTEQRYPFRHVYTGVGKTQKRAIPLAAVRRIRDLNVPLKPSQEFARQMFLFSFMTRGMSFVDMSYLKKSDLRDGVLTYRRRKTGQQVEVKWKRCMQTVVDRLPRNTTEYLLPIIRHAGDERRQYRNAMRLVNNKLKEVSVLAGLGSQLTMYVSRHSWASIARDQNVPVSVISDCLGHESELTTQIYLSSLDTRLVDRANDIVIRELVK